MVFADQGPNYPLMQISSQRQLNRRETNCFLILTQSLIKIYLLAVFIFSLNYSEFIQTPFQIYKSYQMYFAKVQSLVKQLIYSSFSYLSKRYESISNQLLIRSLLRLYRSLRGVFLGLNAKSYIASYYKLSKTLEQFISNPQLYSLMSSFYWLCSTTPQLLTTSTNTLAFFFFSFFLLTTLEIKSRLLKYSPLVYFSRWTQSIYFSWQYTAFNGYSVYFNFCSNERERRQGLRQNLNVLDSMQNSHELTLIQGTRMKSSILISFCFNLNQGIIMELISIVLQASANQVRFIQTSNYNDSQGRIVMLIPPLNQLLLQFLPMKHFLDPLGQDIIFD